MDIRTIYEEIALSAQIEKENHSKINKAMLRRPPEKPYIFNWA